jgi:hypothetical protein
MHAPLAHSRRKSAPNVSNPSMDGQYETMKIVRDATKDVRAFYADEIGRRSKAAKSRKGGKRTRRNRR